MEVGLLKEGNRFALSIGLCVQSPVLGLAFLYEVCMLPLCLPWVTVQKHAQGKSGTLNLPCV